MPNRSTRLRAARVLLTLLLVGAAILVGAGPANATPWGTSGADYNGVLCRLGTTDVPMGSWTVNGTPGAFSLEDITGTGSQQLPAPVTGTTSVMAPGQAGFSPADIGAVAYLLTRDQGGAAAELAELSADVALVAGGGQSQARCLGQNGTSASRAASRLDAARRYAGPYTVQVDAQSGVIPGANADLAVTVRSASGAATPGIDVTVTAGATTASATTGRNGVARTTIAVPAAPATPVTATASVPNGLVYLDTTPPSVTPAAPTTVSGTTVLRPVLHPRPAVSVNAADLVLSGATVRPVANVTGTFGYSGSGEVALLGPVAPAGSEPCSSIPSAALSRAEVSWQDTFTFRGDAQYRTQPTPALTPGCYGLRATVTTTNSSPPERAGSAVATLTVATLRLTSVAAAKAAPPGGLAAAVSGTNPGRATVRTTIEARGPLPVRSAGCGGDFGNAPIAGTSTSTTLRRTGDQLRASIKIPAVRATGCYSLVARNDVTLDGRTLTVNATDPATATTAILKPTVTVAAGAVSGERGKPMPGTVQVAGTFGFPGTVAVGVVAGTTLPISGCRDATFVPNTVPTTTTKVSTRADTAYAFRTPPPPRNACYSVVATFTLTGNAAVAATSGAPNDGSVFLAGIRPDTGAGSVVQKTDSPGIIRAVVIYALSAALILAAAGALVVRTFHREQRRRSATPIFRWRPNRGDGSSEGSNTNSLLGRPMPGDGTSRRPLPTSGRR